MNYLIVHAHPSSTSFTHAILETVKAELAARNQAVQVRDLYPMAFQPLVSAEELAASGPDMLPEDVRHEQELIRWADVLVFVFPIWWGGMPAILKGYVDRVFTPGFAYAADSSGLRGLLEGKRALLITTQGASREDYEAAGMFKAMDTVLNDNLFRLCGIEVIDHRYLCSLACASTAEREEMLREVRQRVAHLAT